MTQSNSTITKVHVNTLFRYLEYLEARDDAEFRRLSAELLTRFAIWLPPTAYAVLPIAVPYAVRDPKCRKKVGGSDSWGCPTPDGYIKDDNSLIKGLPSSFLIEPADSSFYHAYDRCKLGRGFVAAHVWPKIDESARTYRRDDQGYTTRNPYTNSFWPNLVWLPRDLAKLTDYKAFPQKFMQSLSLKIYSEAPLVNEMRTFTDRAWKLLDTHDVIDPDVLPNIESLNFFVVSRDFLKRRLTKIRNVAEVLSYPAADKLLPMKYNKTITTKYVNRLKSELCVEKHLAEHLRKFLQNYADAVQLALKNFG